MGRLEAQQQQSLQQHQPDAWGVAASTEKQSPKNQMNNPSFEDRQHIDHGHEGKNQEFMLTPQTDGKDSRYDVDGRQYSGINGHRHVDEYNRKRPPSEPADENRGFQDVKHSHTDDQIPSIRERAEARRAEEEARSKEQKERATQRLRELEEKMAKNAEKAPAELDTLGSGHINGRTQQHSWHNQPRMLFDPSSGTYSGVSNGEKVASDTDLRSGAGASPPPRKPEFGQENGANQAQYAGPVIHLSSYDDRDRGERGTTAGPRMLFDPKSGSMVAVPVREEAGRGRKERPKRIRNDRESPSVNVLKKAELTSDADYDSTTDKNQRRTSRNRKEDSWHQRSKGRSESAEIPARAETKKKHGSTRKNNDRSFPRTCGVLYARDESGNCYAVDGCDGDVGYGAYSVPGGPTKNPEAYAKFLEKHQNYRHDVPDDVVDDYLCDSEPYNAQVDEGVTLQTGFQIAEPAPAPKIIDWVKPNEKIELVTGVDDSPTLQATAREWAPSRAALAAAAAVAAAGGTTPTTATTTSSKETKVIAAPVAPTVTGAPTANAGVIAMEGEDEEEVREEDVPVSFGISLGRTLIQPSKLSYFAPPYHSFSDLDSTPQKLWIPSFNHLRSDHRKSASSTSSLRLSRLNRPWVPQVGTSLHSARRRRGEIMVMSTALVGGISITASSPAGFPRRVTMLSPLPFYRCLRRVGVEVLSWD